MTITEERSSALAGLHVRMDPDNHEHQHHHHGHPHGGHRHHHHHHYGASGLDGAAAQNRRWLESRGVRGIQVTGLPGAGKTALLECSVREHKNNRTLRAILCNRGTIRDSDRLTALGGLFASIHTKPGALFDAEVVSEALVKLDPPHSTVVVIEDFQIDPPDLGAQAKVVVASTTEGDDKPAKFPELFGRADLVVLNKIDLLPMLNFDTDVFEKSVHKVNPSAIVLQVSALRGDGLEAWHKWVRGM